VVAARPQDHADGRVGASRRGGGRGLERTEGDEGPWLDRECRSRVQVAVPFLRAAEVRRVR
jgi:hypothetical protein